MSLDDPLRPARVRVELLDPPPAPASARDPMDDEVGMFVVVLYKFSGAETRTEHFESPPLKRRHLPWVMDLVRRISKDVRESPEAIDAWLERTARLEGGPEGGK